VLLSDVASDDFSILDTVRSVGMQEEKRKLFLQLYRTVGNLVFQMQRIQAGTLATKTGE